MSGKQRRIDNDMKQLHEMTETERINSINRKIQKKVSQRLHKKLNAIGIKVQLKGLVNTRLQAVIQLPEGLWLLVDMDDLDPEFYISEDRDGFSYIYWYDDNEKLLLDEIKEILEETKNVLRD